MQVVINLLDSDYISIKRYGNVPTDTMFWAIKNGTPLPKGHGRLIDADRLRDEMEKDVRKAMSFTDLEDFVFMAPVLVEADKQEGKE